MGQRLNIEIFNNGQVLANAYCPFCGARMDGEQNDN